MALTETSNTLPEPAMDVAAEDGQPARRLPFTFAKRHGILLQETDDSEIIAVCRPGLDLLRELRTALLVHRVGTDVEAMGATDVLEMATRGGAAVLGRDDIGVLRPGMAADLAVFRCDEIGFAGAGHDPVGALLFCGTTSRSDWARLANRPNPRRRNSRGTHTARR